MCDKFKNIVIWFIFSMSSITENYFERKKKYLNAKSKNGKEKKKVRDSSLDISLNEDNTNVFVEDLDSPRCSGI